MYSFQPALQRFEAGAGRVRELVGVVTGALEVQVEDPESLGTWLFWGVFVCGCTCMDECAVLTYFYPQSTFRNLHDSAAFREAHARLKAMVEEAELRRKQARALQQQQPQQQPGQGSWMGGAPAQEEGQHAELSGAYTEEDRLMRSLLRRACPLVRRKGKVLHELQVRQKAHRFYRRMRRGQCSCSEPRPV